MLDPIKSALILPEMTTPQNGGKANRKYADKEGQYIFVYEGNVRPALARPITPNCLTRTSTRATGICSIPN